MARRVALALLVSLSGTLSAVVAVQPQAPRATATDRDYLLQFQGPVQEPWKTAVAEAGAILLEYVPQFAFRARLRPEQVEAVRTLPYVASLTPFRAAAKLARSRPDNRERPFVLRLDRDANPDDPAAIRPRRWPRCRASPASNPSPCA
jgi:hypothetical protein